MVLPDEDLSAELPKIEAAAKQEAESGKNRRRGRPTKEEDQLFGHRRQMRTFWHVVKLTFLVAFSFAVLFAMLSLFLNWFLPERYRWLTNDQLVEAQKFLLSGVVGSVITFGTTKAIGNLRNPD